MATSAGEIIVELTARVEKLEKGLKKGEKAVEGYRKKLNNFVRAHGIVIATAAAAFSAFVLKATKAASDLQEIQSKFDVVFRGNTETANKFAKELQDSYLLSELSAKRFLASIQDTLVPMGIAREKATGLSAEVVKLAADLGSFNNIPTEMVVRDLQSALVGNTETVKKYGIVLRATDIQQRALADSGKTVASEITQAEKVTAAYNIILEGSADAQGDVARTSDSYANQVRFMNARIEDFMVTLGKLTIGPMTLMVDKLTLIVKGLDEAIESIEQATVTFGGWGQVMRAVVLEALRSITKGTLDFINAMTILGPILKLIGIDIMGQVKAKLDEQFNAWQASGQAAGLAAQAASDAENKKRQEVEATNQTIVKSEVERQAQLTELAKQGDEAKKERDKQKKEDEKAAFELSEQWRKQEADDANKLADDAVERSKRIKKFFMMDTKEHTEFAIQQAQAMFNNFGSGVADMVLEGRKFADVMKGIWQDMARAFISYVAQMIAKWLAFMALKAAFSFASGGAGAFFQEGGLIREPSIITGLRSGRQALAGEAGTEAVVPVGGGTNISAQEMGTSFRGAGGGGGVNLTINISGQFLEGSETKWHSMFRDKIIPEVRRFTMSSPTGPFNRRRGVV